MEEEVKDPDEGLVETLPEDADVDDLLEEELMEEEPIVRDQNV